MGPGGVLIRSRGQLSSVTEWVEKRGFLVPGTCNNFARIENGDLTGGKKRFFRMRKRESSGCAK